MKTLHFSTLPIMTLSLALAAPLLQPEAAFASRGDRHERILKQLDLTPEQSEKLAKLRHANREKSKEAHAEMRQKREALEKAMDSDASSDELRRLHEDLQKARAKLGDLRFDQILAVRDVLTPEQRKKFKELKEEKRGKKHGKRRHKR